MHASLLYYVQLMVVRQARCQRLPRVSRGMLRLVLLSGGVHLSLRMRKINSACLDFWGAALADAWNLDLELHHFTEQRMQQLAAAAPGGAFPGVTQLLLEVC